MFLLQLFFQSKDSAEKIIQRTKSENSPAEVCREEEIGLEESNLFSDTKHLYLVPLNTIIYSWLQKN